MTDRAPIWLLCRIAIIVAVLPARCTPPPYAIVKVEDPRSLAADATMLAYGDDLDQLHAIPITGDGYPFEFLVWHDGAIDATIWLDALDVNNRILARGRVKVTIARSGRVSVIVELGDYCRRQNSDGTNCALPENDAGKNYAGVCTDAGTCERSLCGDGYRSTEESCDDGYSDPCGSCNEDCSAVGGGAVCGDGILCPEYEACDDGYADVCGSCNADCSGGGTGDLGSCGDSVLCREAGETCDDANSVPGDGCNTICLVDSGCGEVSCNINRPSFPVSGARALVRTPGTEPVVSDSLTGLFWQGCAAGLSGNSCGTGTRATKTWPEALAYCWGLTWNGYDDWYLPDEYELQSVVDYGNFDPAVDVAAFPATPPGVFWTSSSLASDTPQAWRVTFHAGRLGSSAKDNLCYVRCVRRQTFSIGERFSRTTGDEPVVTDNATGLDWQGCAGGQQGADCGTGIAMETSRGVAFDYCAALTWAGVDSWYLPDAKELRSIVDNREAYPAIDTVAFPQAPSAVFLTSSFQSVPSPSPITWRVDFGTGIVVEDDDQPATRRVRCVRRGP